MKIDDRPDAVRPEIMTALELMKLLDAAMRSHGAEAFLAGMQSAFNEAGRQSDALQTGMLRTLLQSDEIETVMYMRAEWLGRMPAPQFHPTRPI